MPGYPTPGKSVLAGGLGVALDKLGFTKSADRSVNDARRTTLRLPIGISDIH